MSETSKITQKLKDLHEDCSECSVSDLEENMDAEFDYFDTSEEGTDVVSSCTESEGEQEKNASNEAKEQKSSENGTIWTEIEVGSQSEPAVKGREEEEEDEDDDDDDSEPEFDWSNCSGDDESEMDSELEESDEEASQLPSGGAFKEIAGPTSCVKGKIIKEKKSSAFSLLIDPEIMEHIRVCTEAEASRVLETTWELSPAKFNAFIGLVIARGCCGANTDQLWDANLGIKLFQDTMPMSCFNELMQFIRFDKKSDRNQRLQADRFALISEVWNKFIQNCQNCFKPGEHLNIAEQVFPSKHLRRRKPTKTDEFGVKYWLATDVASKYVVNGFLYWAKDDYKEPATPLGDDIVLKLIEPFTGCGRNILIDKRFTNVPLAAKLKQKNTTLWGRISKSRKGLPELTKQMPRYSTKFYKSDNCTLTVYKAKSQKRVLVLSSMHKTVNIEKDGKHKPDTFKFFNDTKFHQIVEELSVKKHVKQWPLQVFFNILDLAIFNSWILYRKETGKKISKSTFIFDLAEEFIEEHRRIEKEKAEAHQKNLNLQKSLRM